MSETKKEKSENQFKTIYDVLGYIQKNLNAPKNQFNKFGNYHFRNCEDIQQGLKEVMPDGATSFVSDEIVEIAGRVYVKATATLCYQDKCVSNSAYAREPVDQKGMSVSQVTGAASSYARKYALGGLYMVDDQKDADSQDNKSEVKKKEATPEQRKILADAKAHFKVCETPEQVTAWFYDNVKQTEKLEQAQADWLNSEAKARREELEKAQ